MITIRMIASWSRGADNITVGFEVRYKVGDGNYRLFQTNDTVFEIDGLEQGRTLTFEVRSVGPEPLSKKSAWVSTTAVVPSPDIDPDDPDGVTRPPIPANVTIQAIDSDQAILRWEIPPTALNISGFIAIIRHASETDGTAEWPTPHCFVKSMLKRTSRCCL